MKKFIALLIAVFIMVPCTLCACTEKYSYFYPEPFWYNTVEDDESIELPEAKEPSEKQIETCTKVFKRLCDYYNIQKDLPNIKNTNLKNLKETTGTEAAATYVDGCLYLLNTSNKAIIAHELCHYMSDSGKYVGFEYELNQYTLTGHYLTEGINTYLATQLYPEDEPFYEFENHVAKLIALTYGDKNLSSDFFKADVNGLRDDFNEAVKDTYSNLKLYGIKATPFDILCGSLDAYGFWLYVYDDSPGLNYNRESEAFKYALSIEEMLLFYAKGKGKEDIVRAEIESFVETCTMPINFQILLTSE